MAYAGGAGGAEQSSQKVLHVKGLADHIGQADVETYFGQFGGVALTMMMRQPGTVLVEMATLEQAQTVISYGQSMPLKLGGQLLKIDFSRSQAINRAAAARAAGNAAPPAGHPPPTSSQPPPPHSAAHMPPHTMPPAGGPAYGAAGGGPPPPASNAILHFTVRNAVHPLTVHTLQQLFAPHGQVLRMVMFYKNTLQGFVEFADTQAAGAAKAALSGQDIYDGCCHLSVQEARNHGPLNVRGANDHNVDFTNPTLAPQPLRGLDPEQIAESERARAAGLPPPSFPPPPRHPPSGPAYAPPAQAPGHGRPGPGAGGCVALLYNVSDAFMGVDNVFNLACCYGNVSRVRRLTHKSGMVLVQMEDGVQVAGLMKYLTGAELFGETLRVEVSKFPQITPPPQLEDFMTINGRKTRIVSYRDLAGQPELVRFKRPEHFANIHGPHAVLHASNIPHAMYPVDLRQLLATTRAPEPTRIMFFPPSATAAMRGGRMTGLLQFPSVVAATEALALANNAQLDSCVLRLAFSDQAIRSPGAGDVRSCAPPSPQERSDFVRMTGLGVGLEDPGAAEAASGRASHPPPGESPRGGRDHDQGRGAGGRYDPPPAHAPPPHMPPPPGMPMPPGMGHPHHPPHSQYEPPPPGTQ